MKVSACCGDIADQDDVEVIVNSWNRNILPWWLLLPQGVSRSIKKKAGFRPFNELARMGVLDLGEAVVTSAGRLPYKAIIHVAGINFLWRASKYSIETSVVNAVKKADELGVCTIAMPLIGSGSGGFNKQDSKDIICKTLKQIESSIEVRLVMFQEFDHNA